MNTGMQSSSIRSRNVRLLYSRAFAPMAASQNTRLNLADASDELSLAHSVHYLKDHAGLATGLVSVTYSRDY